MIIIQIKTYFYLKSSRKDKFSKELGLTAVNRSKSTTSNFISNPKSQLSTDNLLENIECAFIISFANTVLKKFKAKKNVTRPKYNKWLDLNCQEIQENLLYATKSYSRFPQKPFSKKKLFSAKT